MPCIKNTPDFCCLLFCEFHELNATTCKSQCMRSLFSECHFGVLQLLKSYVVSIFTVYSFICKSNTYDCFSSFYAIFFHVPISNVLACLFNDILNLIASYYWPISKSFTNSCFIIGLCCVFKFYYVKDNYLPVVWLLIYVFISSVI